MTSGSGKNCCHHFSVVVAEKFLLTIEPYQRGGYFFRHVSAAGGPHFAAHQIKSRSAQFDFSNSGVGQNVRHLSENNIAAKMSVTLNMITHAPKDCNLQSFD